MRLDIEVIERARKLRDDMPLLIQPSQSDHDAVNMLNTLEWLTNTFHRLKMIDEVLSCPDSHFESIRDCMKEKAAIFDWCNFK